MELFLSYVSQLYKKGTSMLHVHKLSIFSWFCLTYCWFGMDSIN